MQTYSRFELNIVILLQIVTKSKQEEHTDLLYSDEAKELDKGKWNNKDVI